MKRLLSLSLAVILLFGAVALFSSCSTEQGVKIGAQKASTGEFFLAGNEDMGYEKFKNIDTKSYDTVALAVEDLLSGKVELVISDNATAADLVKGNEGLKLIDYALTEEDFAIGVDKDQKALLTSINRKLSEKKAEIDAIYESYEGVNADNASEWSGTKITSARYDPDKKDSQLVVATNAKAAPYAFKVGNDFAGIDMEIAKLIAETLGLELVISDMDLSAVVTSVGENGIDIAISSLTVTPAREKLVNFSTPYKEGGYQVLIAKKDNTTFDGCKSAAEVLDVLKNLKK